MLWKGNLKMLTAIYEETNRGYVRHMTVWEIDAQTLSMAHKIFDDYKMRGVILNDSFNDDIWQLSNQTHKTSLIFHAFGDIFRNKALQWIGCDEQCYCDCAKAYITFNLGNMGLSSLRSISEAFRRLVDNTIDEAVIASRYMTHIIGLLQIIPGSSEKRDYVIEELEEKLEQRRWQYKKGNQRCLADFSTYLKFDEILSQFWQCAGHKQKLFYFPLYLWWNLTAILPLRPTEFLLTPRDCLEIADNGDNVFTVRRTKIKGGIEKVTYRISGDYECKKYVIHEKLAGEIRSYIKSTAKMRQTELGTLLLREPHCNHLKNLVKLTGKYYSYDNLNICLQKFYDEVIGAKRTDIKRINLGDTRHIAMANLIISGGSPVICRELAGHSDIDISSHYYSNISNLVECVTLERYRKSRGESAKIDGTPKYAVILPDVKHRVSDGWCDVLSVKDGDVSECLKVSDKDGYIGNCDCCIHYWPDQQGLRLAFLDVQTGKQEINADSQYLMRMIESVRKGLGHTEDIGAALLRLQRSSDHYSKCLWEKYMKVDD